MDILFSCDQCGKHCCVSDRAAGKTFACPDCTAPIHAPPADIVFPCPACDALCAAGPALHDTDFRCPACETIITIPHTAILSCPSCGIQLEMEPDYYAQIQGCAFECPECKASLPAPALPQTKPNSGSPHPPGFGHKTLKLDSILESIPQADLLRSGHCPFCGGPVTQLGAKSYTCANCARQILMTAPTIKRAET